MLESLRLFKASGLDFKDLTIPNQLLNSQFKPVMKVGEFIYIGQTYPFNNLHFWMKQVNELDSKIKIEYLSNNDWVEMSDLLDSTAIDNKSLAKSGVVYFTPDPEKSWTRTLKSIDIAELEKCNVFNSYWLRISFDHDLSEEISLEEISYCFADTSTLTLMDISISRYIENFESGKSDWISELVLASKEVVKDLKRNGVIRDRGQLLTIEEVSTATAQKALIFIYNQIGGSYTEKIPSMQKAYDKSISLRSFVIDKNKNAIVDIGESQARQNRIVR